MNEQTGVRVGAGGMDVKVHQHSQLDGAIIESNAEKEVNHFSTESFGHRALTNYSKLKTESASLSVGSGGINPMQGISSALSLLGNHQENKSSQTKAAVSGNIQIETKMPENLTALSRDTAQANERVGKADLGKVQESQEMAKVLGNIADNSIAIATYNQREEIARLKREKAKVENQQGKESPQAQALNTQIQQLEKNLDTEFGLGRAKGMVIRAVTAALQSAVQNDSAGALTALASPYINQAIHQATEGNQEANLMAHALLSAVEFAATGKDPITGAIAGVTGEATAQYLTKALYNKTPNELTASEKENISTLSQLAGGLAGAFTAKATGNTTQQGGSFLSAVAGAETAKRAVENNYLSVLSQKRRDDIREKIKNGKATKKEIVEYLQYEKDDHTSDYLVDKALHHPEEMTPQEWAEYENYAKRYVSESIQNREIPQDIERNLKEILTGNYYKGYGYAYALDEKYRSSLPSRWFISDSDKSAEEKMYEELNAKYIQNPKVFRESFEGRLALSVKEGLELAAGVYTGNIFTGSALNIVNKLGPVGKQIVVTAEKYPLLTEKMADSGLSVGFTYLGNSLNGKETTTKDLLWSGGTGFVTGGTSFKTTLGVNILSSGIEAYVDDEDPIYHSFSSGIATIAGGSVGKIIEKGSYRVLVGNTSKYKSYYKAEDRNKNFYNLGNEEYKINSYKIGVLSDYSSTGYINNLLDKNENIIKNKLEEKHSEK
ncbi:VENN motif pre-toxin domain-containing protein [Avibacterium avium]|uniref:VENN motif pre-toxin domain-containing protein n=2 Tax=Avibacterium avium TaxID=751 RepID=UPI003BF7AFE9